MSIDSENTAPKPAVRRPALAATLRGARFGALIAGGIMLLMGLIGLGIGIGGIGRAPRPSLVDFFGMLGGFALFAVFGAFVGAAIMGTMATVRLHWPRKPD